MDIRPIFGEAGRMDYLREALKAAVARHRRSCGDQA
jgi:hypothetical protein